MIVSREMEDLALAHANGTCQNGDSCISPTSVPGTAFVQGKCVMCCRYETTKHFNDMFDYGTTNLIEKGTLNPYTNISNEYPESSLLDKTDIHVFKCIDGPFVLFNENDYTLVDEFKVTQKIAKPNCINWFETLIDIEKSSLPAKKKWVFAYCKSSKCKKNFFSIVDQQSATGMTDTVYNLETDTLQCSTCKIDVEYIYSNDYTNFVTYNEEDYTKCSFCDTIVKFDVRKSPSACSGCVNMLSKRAQDAKKVCLYCNIHVNTSRRGGNKCITQSDGTVIYLCKLHSKNFVSS